jgi:hypothetical protein
MFPLRTRPSIALILATGLLGAAPALANYYCTDEQDCHQECHVNRKGQTVCNDVCVPYRVCVNTGSGAGDVDDGYFDGVTACQGIDNTQERLACYANAGAN